jgi:agmatine deiminase
MNSPQQEGFRQPAEWAAHSACWLAWPFDAGLWMENLPAAQTSFARLCAAIADLDPETGKARGERLEILVPDAVHERVARQALGPVAEVARFHPIPFGDIWVRDTAPIFVKRGNGEVAAVAFKFNGWGGKYVLAHDDGVAMRVAAASGLRVFEADFVLEGGSVEVDGEGTLLTTRQCLLNSNRGSSTQAGIEARLKAQLGAEKVLWLGDGLINDHTDGHIDTVARFIAPGRVLCMRPVDGEDPNRVALEQMAEDLRGFTDARGRKLEVVQITSPGRVENADGEVMAASYVNFYLGNRTVVVPTYGTRFDDEAVAAIGALFPGRRTVGVPAKAILTGGGAFHCITQQQPL